MKFVSTFVLMCALAKLAVAAPIIFESASLGVTGVQFPGSAIAPAQYIGVRFEIDQTTIVSAVGGHISSNPNVHQDLFAAIVPLAGATAVPAESPGTFSPLAVTTFLPPILSDDIRVPLSVTLDPGWYALIFGSGRFGATGEGALISNGAPLPGISQASFFHASSPFLLAPPPNWQAVSSQVGTRYVVEGVAVPEPSSVLLFTGGAGALLLLLRRPRFPAPL
jgi:hypothetical protein